MKMRRDQSVVEMDEVPLEDVRDVLDVVLKKLNLVLVRADGQDYREYEVLTYDELSRMDKS